MNIEDDQDHISSLFNEISQKGKKRVTYFRRDWKLLGTFAFTAKIYLSRERNVNQYWISRYKYKRSKPNYTTYACFDPNCKAEIKISELEERKTSESHVMRSIAFDTNEIYGLNKYIEVHIHGIHIEHDIILIEQYAKKRDAYGDTKYSFHHLTYCH
jgi:hypothetical protein